MESIIQSLVELDHKLFFFLNGAHNPVLDFVMKWLSNIYVWIPLYAILTAGLFYRFSRKKILACKFLKGWGHIGRSTDKI